MTLRRLNIALAVILLIAVGANAALGIDNYERLGTDISRTHSEVAAAIVQSRRESCEAAEKLRAQNRANVAKEKRDLKRNLKLLPLFNTPPILKLTRERWARELGQNAHVDCIAYSRRLKP